MKKALLQIPLSICLFCNLAAQTTQTKPDQVPDEATALQVAEKNLISIYGKENIARERPLVAHLEKGIWIVSGSLPKLMVGGVASIKIDRRTGKVISYQHTK